MNSRKIVIGAALVLIGLPIVLVLIVYGSFYAVFYFPNRTSATTGSIVSSAEKREYLLYVPKSYDRAKPTPLVINLHTAMSWPTSSMNISQWNLVADEDGFIVVYPAGTGFGSKSWEMTGSETPSRMPDVIFISELIDKLEVSYNIDKTRIYADGMSNGGGMAFNGGRTKFGDDIFPSVPSFMANWARRNRCGPNPMESAFAADVTRLQYTDCADDASVLLYTVKGEGHQWPGGKPIVAKWLVGPYSHSIDATRQMWGFFREHALPRK